jgi:hypothetical protein
MAAHPNGRAADGKHNQAGAPLRVRQDFVAGARWGLAGPRKRHQVSFPRRVLRRNDTWCLFRERSWRRRDRHKTLVECAVQGAGFQRVRSPPVRFDERGLETEQGRD